MPTRSRQNAARSMHRARMRRLKARAREQGLDSVLITNPYDVAYLTGFLGGDSYLFVPCNGQEENPVVISDFRYEQELEPLKAQRISIHLRKGPMTEATLGLIGYASADRVGVQGDHLTAAERDHYAGSLGAGRLVTAIGLVAPLRRVKDEIEVELIRKAIRIQEEALRVVRPTIKPGQTELQIAGRLEAEMKSRGSREPGFQTIVATGANGSLPHYRPGKAKVRNGGPVLIDWGAVYEGYHGDMTRTFALGKWPKKIRDIYKIVLEAHEAAAAALRPGASSRAIDRIARDIIAAAGYGENYGHGLGHGLGFNGHEDPRLHFMTADVALEPGNIVTIEPGIYLPGVGGVRIEDDYLVSRRGAENLCSLPRDAEWATL